MKKNEFKKLTLDKAKKDLAVPDKKVMKLQKARPILIKFLRFHVSASFPMGIPTTE